MRHRLLVLLLSVALGCQPGDEQDQETQTLGESAWVGQYAHATCNLSNAECDCTETWWASLDECLEYTVSGYEMFAAQARAAGLTYDPVCAAQSVAWTTEFGCKTALEYDGEEQCSTCTLPDRIYYGDVAEGEACKNYGLFSDCAQGLGCFYGVCVDRCNVPEAPRVGEGESCASQGDQPPPLCEEGLRCDNGGTDTCVVVPGIGEACPDGKCVSGAYCSDADPAMPVCVAYPADGEPCPEGECGYDSFCEPQEQGPAICVRQPMVCRG